MDCPTLGWEEIRIMDETDVRNIRGKTILCPHRAFVCFRIGMRDVKNGNWRSSRRIEEYGRKVGAM